MAADEWAMAPVGIGSRNWMTRKVKRHVLVVVHAFASVQRLLDVVGQVESDPRVQVVFTQGPDAFADGVEDYLCATGTKLLPWRRAVNERFDLALAAGYGGLHELHAPVLVMPHGAGYSRNFAGRSVYGLDAQRLTHNGRVVPAAVVLSHENQLPLLAEQCPEAVPMAVVAGDPCYDRLVASEPLRPAYRDAYGVGPGGELVLVTSHWGSRALFDTCFDLLGRLVDELPTRFRVVLTLHPCVWFGHSVRQIRAWLTDLVDAGLILLRPEDDWRSALIAADHVIGDRTSVTSYAAAIGRPVLHTDPSCEDVAESSPHALLGSTAPRFARGKPLLPQLRRAAASYTAASYEAVAARLTSVPGRSRSLLRSTMYRLLRLTEPGRHREVDPVPVPQL